MRDCGVPDRYYAKSYAGWKSRNAADIAAPLPLSPTATTLARTAVASRA
jgi:hypothetical protein